MTTTNVSQQIDAPVCPYCGFTATLVTGDCIYPLIRALHKKNFWLCTECDAYVGCHSGTERPLGRLASAELRRTRMRAHHAFDPLWQSCGMDRTEAYAWLARKLKIKADQCHIGMFDVATCLRTVDLCLEFINEQRGRPNLQEE